jgi:hypothetical protein
MHQRLTYHTETPRALVRLPLTGLPCLTPTTHSCRSRFMCMLCLFQAGARGEARLLLPDLLSHIVFSSPTPGRINFRPSCQDGTSETSTSKSKPDISLHVTLTASPMSRAVPRPSGTTASVLLWLHP